MGIARWRTAVLLISFLLKQHKVQGIPNCKYIFKNLTWLLMMNCTLLGMAELRSAIVCCGTGTRQQHQNEKRLAAVRLPTENRRLCVGKSKCHDGAADDQQICCSLSSGWTTVYSSIAFDVCGLRTLCLANGSTDLTLFSMGDLKHLLAFPLEYK